jgi:hypothetical protein
MTEEKLNDLKERAKDFIGKKIQMKFKNRSDIMDFEFKDIAYIGLSENKEKKNYRAYAILISDNNKEIREDLESIILHFENSLGTDHKSDS